MRDCKIISLFILLILPLTSCLSDMGIEFRSISEDELQGQILIWHTWQGQEQTALRGLLDGFTELHPNVSIVEEFYDIEDIQEIYRYQIEAGLGPDILIAPASWAESLADERLIQDISNREDVNLDIYLKAALDMLRANEKVYGLPLSLNTQVLYYNKTLLNSVSVENNSPTTQEPQATITSTTAITDLNPVVEPPQNNTQIETFSPPRTLDELLQQANKDHQIALPTDFYNAFWGIQAFGGQLFDDEDRVVLNQGGFANWLGWLKKANENPNIILNRNLDELKPLFTNGRATYYVGSTQEYPTLQTALGPENVGVIRLPGRQNKAAGPFLQAEALMFNQATTENSTDLSLRLAQYLTNSEQQRKLALNIGKLPTNNRVNIDPRVSEAVAEFIAQSKTAVPIQLENIERLNHLLDSGNDIYAQVLEGELSVGDAATLLTEQINDRYGFETIITQQEDCEVSGTITLWSSWNEQESETLQQLVDQFMRQCPNAFINIEPVESVELLDLYLEAIELGETPDIMIGDNTNISILADQEALLNLSQQLDSEFSQRFIPLVEQTALYQDNLYGIPIDMNLMVMYYNQDLVEDPPVVLNDLLAIASTENQIAIPIDFVNSYWGIAAFGESGEQPIFDETGHLLLGELGLTEWLTWLKEAQTTPGMVLDTDWVTLQELFITEQAGLIVGDAKQLNSLQTELGQEKLGVVPLPSGSPLLKVELFLLSPFSSLEQQAVALAFAQFMTDIERQEILLAETNKIPTNINVSTVDYPIIEAFIEQANTATVLPNVSQVEAMLEWGNVVYEQVLDNDIAPEDAVHDFITLVDATNGIAVAETETIEDCTEEGEITLWHSWSGVEQLTWQTVISDFVEICPGIQLNTVVISDTTFTEQLTRTLEADSEMATPHFFIASHTNLETFQTNNLIRDIHSLVNADNLIDYLPKSINAFSRGEELYGLPQTIAMPALYYQVDLVENPATTIEQLLVQASEGLTVGIPINFYDVMWGASTLGCEPCLGGQYFNDQGELNITNSDIIAWRDWLRAVNDSEQFIFSQNQAELQQLFLDGQIAYLVAGPDFVNRAQEILGTANVGITGLPSGEEERISRPFLLVDGFYFTQESTDEETKLALKFAEFVTNETQQTLLMQGANFIPTRNIALVTADDPIMGIFINQIDSTILLPRQNQRLLIEESPIYRTFDSLTDDLAIE